MWFDKKAEVGDACPFPNLPYLLDEGGIGLAQSNAILRYVGRKFGLMGPPSAAHLVDLVLDQTSDFDKESTSRSYGGGLAALTEYCRDETQLASRLSEWSKFLADKPFFTGDACTVADLKAYETLRKIQIIEREVGSCVLAAHPNLCQLIERVEALPAIKAYIESEAFMPRPLNNDHARFR